MQQGLEEMKQQYLTTVEKIRGGSGHLAQEKQTNVFSCDASELSFAPYGRRRDGLPPREPRAGDRDDPRGGAAGAAGHGQKDAALLSELSAGVAGGRGKGHRARHVDCPTFLLNLLDCCASV